MKMGTRTYKAAGGRGVYLEESGSFSRGIFIANIENASGSHLTREQARDLAQQILAICGDSPTDITGADFTKAA